MPITRNLADAIIRQQQQSLSLRGIGSQQRGRTVLGGSSGSGGGSGGPPGGFVGKLIQTRVCYDTTEAASSSGDSSLLDNLNHIRYDIATIEGNYLVNSSGSSTDNALVRWHGTSGSLAQNGIITEDGSGNLAGVGDIALDSISADANDIDIQLTDNRADALQVLQGASLYASFRTLNGSEYIRFFKTLHMGDQNITNVSDIALDSMSADDGSSFTINNDWTNTGNTIADLGSVTTVDINAGTVDGVVISSGSISGGLTWLAAQNLNNQALTNINVDSGSIDGTVIGANSATAGTFTSLSVSGGNITNVGNVDGVDVSDHSDRHEDGGADAIKLDDLASPEDNTDLDATTVAHGLLPKLDDDSSHYLDGQGSWTTPPGADCYYYTSQACAELSNETVVHIIDDAWVNVFLGDLAGANLASGMFNTGVGAGAGNAMTDGNYNTLGGYSAGVLLTTGDANTLSGFGSGALLTSGSANAAVGYGAGGGTSGSSSGNVFLGYLSGFSETGSNKLYIENSSGSNPLIYGEFDNDYLRINGSLDVGRNSALRGALTLWDGAGGNTPGYACLGSPNGTLWYLFVEDDGSVKIHNAVPTQNSDGTVIGAQT